MSHIPHSHSTWSSSWDAPAICQASPMPGGEGFPKKQPKLLIPYLQLILSCHSGNKNGHQKRKNNSLEEVILCNPSNLSSNVPHPYLPLSKVEWFLKKHPSSVPPSPWRPQRGSRLMLRTGPQQSSPMPFLPWGATWGATALLVSGQDFCWCNFLFQLNFYSQQKTLHLYHVNELYLAGESGSSSEFHGSNHISHKLSVRVLPLSVKLPKLKKARVSWPTTAAISCINIRSKVAAHDGPDGNEVEQRESGPSVQLEDIEEWMQLEPQ